jgi:NAD(P)-dependent dehydrogenase (short-subunit alcohol dehydrogenase family)
MITPSLVGQVAVVTGASSGLGVRFAKTLAQNGASVALMARRTDRLAAVVAQIEADGGKAVAIALDVADAAAIGPALDAAEAALGPISILINNAGVAGEGRALDISVEDWDATFAVNTRGVFFAAREAALRMIASGVAEQGQARIVNIASIAAANVLPGVPAYCASKAAVVSLTKSLAREWSRKLIAVNAICPGFIETAINEDWFKTEGGQKQIRSFPRRRLMLDSDLDAVLLTLSGPGAHGMTGSIITIDDGQYV